MGRPDVEDIHVDGLNSTTLRLTSAGLVQGQSVASSEAELTRLLEGLARPEGTGPQETGAGE